MKHSLILSLILSLFLHGNAYAESAANSCGLTTEEIDAINLSTGIARLGLLSTAVPIIDNPNLAKPVGDPASSDSVAMNNLSEMYGASELAANEQTLQEQNTQMGNRCNNPQALEEAKVNGTLQLYSQACIVYELVNRVTNMMAEVDALEKQLVEDKATQNKAAAENAKREADIKAKKDKMEKVNKDITKSIKEIEKAKEELEKAKEEKEAAQKALDAANAQTCPEDDDGSCASAKAAAVAAAQKALDEATKKVEKAEKKLNKAVAKLVDYLADKMGIETLAVFSLLTGTITGETDGGDVHFKVNSNDFTLADLGTVIGGFTGTTEEKARQFTDGEEVNRGTDTFFYNLVRGVEASEDRGHTENPYQGGIDSNYVGFYNTTGSVNDDAKATVKESLDILANLDNGIDYIQTIALAALDFNEDASTKQIAALEAMKTPSARMDEMARKMEEKNTQKEKLQKMITKTLCYLDSSLALFKGFFKATTTNVTDQFYIYINKFTTDKLNQKAKEGFFSKVNYLGIQKAFECYAKGGNTNSCSAQETTANDDSVKSCHWSGAVIGPSKPIELVCDASKIGQVATNDSGNEQTCVCQ